MENNLRLFFAYPLTDEEKLYFSNMSFKYREYFDGRWVDKKNYHITVKFLGEVKKSFLNTIIENFEKNVNSLEGSSIKIDRCGFFGKPKPKVFWLGSSFVDDKIIRNFEVINNTMNILGFKKDNVYIPHITICRLKYLKKALKNEHNIEGLTIRIKSIVLYKSTLTPKGSKYEKLKEWQI